MLNKKNTALCSKQCAVRLIQASWNSETVFLVIRPARIEIRVTLQHAGYM